MRLLACALAMLALQGCAVVEVQEVQTGDAHLSVWPLGVHVTTTDQDAVSVSSASLGLTSGCGETSLGFRQEQCSFVSATVCGVAIVRDVPSESEGIIGELSDATLATCKHQTGEDTVIYKPKDED